MNDLGRIIKQQRTVVPITIRELAATSGVSTSHLSRVERGERSPSANVLRRIAKPLGFDEDELFMLAGYLSPQPRSTAGNPGAYSWLDPYVATVLGHESVDIQRTVIEILGILKRFATVSGKRAPRM